MSNKRTLIDDLHEKAMNKNKNNNKSTGGKKKMKNNLILQVTIVLVMVLVISAMFQSVAFADEVKAEENINLVDIMEQTKESGFSIITMSRVEEKDNRLYLLDEADFTTIEFNEEININNGTEDLKLRSLVLNIIEDEIVPIYNPKVNYIQALISKMNKERYTPLKLIEKYQLQFDASSVLFGDNSPTESVLKRDVSDLIFTDYMNGVDVETLKQEYGINDDYIRFVIEPKAIYNCFTITLG